jgi:flagellar FliJ protein
MPEHSPLPLLIDLAHNDRDAIMRQFGTAQRLLSDNEAQLQSLQAYQTEYLARLNRTSHSGASQLRNFHAFLVKLETAVAQQAAAVEQHRQRTKALGEELTQINMKIKSFEVLLDKRKLVALQKTRRNENKLEDEHAARMVRSSLAVGTQ